ncbi:MAG: M1 family metallopeptidase [Pyrinomonadaceae bacterium]
MQIKPARKASKCFFIIVACLAVTLGAAARADAQRELGVRPDESGGPLMPEQAAYDVKFYDLALKINPTEQSISGALTAEALIVHPIEWFVLDLDAPLTVSAVASLDSNNRPESLKYERRGGKIWIAFPNTKQPGETVKVRVDYRGRPRVAPRPPWVGGFVWAKTAGGDPWVGVACQIDGADLWWPCKDHPSDEPDRGVALHITVAENLIVAANGRLQNVTKNKDGTHTYHWLTSTPINNYDVTINVAPYRVIEGTYRSISGETFPVTFWALPESHDQAQKLFPRLLEYIKFYEDRLGPYPFRAEKLGIAQTAYLGMEHQTINAYGNDFKMNAYGFDGLMFHELGHEWWGNLVTALDWRDFWLHEGFDSYMDALYAGELRGEAGYRQYMAGMRKGIRNQQPVAPREARTAMQIYMAAPDYLASDGDIYSKGAWTLHTLRYLIGDEAFFVALRRMAYPNAELERVTNGRQCRFATTDDFRRTAEEASGMKLDWFFDIYLRQPQLPRLIVTKQPDELTLAWETPGDISFPMPIEIKVGDRVQKIEMHGGAGRVSIAAGAQIVIDPHERILKAD